jgi:hypothetical protein
MRTVRRITLAASLAAMVVTGIAIGHTAGAAPRATTTQHSITVRGVEWRSLDFRFFPQYVPNTGGGVYAHVAAGHAIPSDIFLEAAMPVPVGAVINQVTFYLQDCGTDVPSALGQWYFATYDPTQRKGHFILPIADTPPSMRDCQFHSFIRTVSPAVKVLATTKYVAGVDTHFVSSADAPAPNPDFVVEGAKVRYTCPNGC